MRPDHADHEERPPEPRPVPHIFIDFMRIRERRADGTEVYALGAVDPENPRVRGLREDMPIVCEDTGELQMSGVVRRRRGDYGEYWAAELDPATLVYHIRLDGDVLAAAGPQSYGRHFVHVPVPGALPESGDEHEPAAEGRPAPASGERARPEAWLEGKLERRALEPARALTLGAEGTYEVWSHNLTAYTVYGEVALAEGQPIVLVDDTQEVDARVRVLRLPADAAYPRGRRVWLAEPEWGTLRTKPL